MKIIVAGAGRIGQYLVDRLSVEQHDITVIDAKDGVLDELGSRYDIRTIAGNASSVTALRNSNIENADIIVAVTNSDETNIITCIHADGINPEIKKIARLRELLGIEEGLSARVRSVFDEIINPDEEAACYLARAFEVPGACDVIDFAEGKVRVAGFVLSPNSPVVGKALKDLRGESVPEDMLVVAIVRMGQLIIPRGEDRLSAGDTVYVASEPELTAQIYEINGQERHDIRSVMIWGGHGLGPLLAKKLLPRGVKVKLIEKDTERCEQLASELDEVLVLAGDGADQELLREEGIEDTDVFVGATEDGEKNTLGALLAKRLGAKFAAVAVNKTSYLDLVTTLGVDVVVSPMIAGASSILKYIRAGTISSVFSTRDDLAEVLEIVADEKSKIVGKPLKDIRLPAGVIVAAVVHADTVTIPQGETVIGPGDHIVCFAHRAALPKLGKLLEVKLSFF